MTANRRLRNARPVTTTNYPPPRVPFERKVIAVGVLLSVGLLLVVVCAMFRAAVTSAPPAWPAETPQVVPVPPRTVPDPGVRPSWDVPR